MRNAGKYTIADVLAILVLAKTSFNPFTLFDRAVGQYPDGKAYLASGRQYFEAINGISFGLALLLGTAGLPHVLMRFFTVPDARAARSSISWAVLLIGAFFVMTMIVGVGARAILGQGGVEASAGGNLATPLLAEELGGGAGERSAATCSWRSSARSAFATILAVVAGLVIASSGAVAHDLWSSVVRRGQIDERGELRVARGLAFAVAASANLPALLCALFWPRFTTSGALAGVLGGLGVATVLIVLSPPVWPGPDSEGSPIALTNPAIISIPAGFVCCWLGTVLSREKPALSSYHELHVRSETGLGAAR